LEAFCCRQIDQCLTQPPKEKPWKTTPKICTSLPHPLALG
jgi:hypothetical protein